MINDSQQTIDSLIVKPEFKELVLLGPPKQLRWLSWLNLLTKTQPNIPYEKYLENPPTDISNIIKDIDRTLVDYALFKHKSCGQEQLKRILWAISNALPSMGYCQGMNFICAVLLIVSGCDEHQVFQAFMYKQFLFHFYYKCLLMNNTFYVLLSLMKCLFIFI